MPFDERAKRLKVKIPVQMTDPKGKVFTGMTNDLSTTGFSAFLRCKEDFVVDELVDSMFSTLR